MLDKTAVGALACRFAGRAVGLRGHAARRGVAADDPVAFLTGLAERGEKMTSAAGLSAARAAMIEAVRLKALAEPPDPDGGLVRLGWADDPEVSEAEWFAAAGKEAWDRYYAQIIPKGPDALRAAVTPAPPGARQRVRAQPPEGEVPLLGDPDDACLFPSLRAMREQERIAAAATLPPAHPDDLSADLSAEALAEAEALAKAERRDPAKRL